MKKTFLAIPLLAMLALMSCNNQNEKTATADSTKSTATDTTKAVAEKPKEPEFKPFDVVEVNHIVKNYEKWKPGFDNDSAARKEAGLELMVIGRSDANPNNLNIVLQASDIAKAKAFAGDPRLKEVMKKNGVTSKPEIHYYHVIRFNADSKEKQWVLVTHKVKDFDAWVKVFDSEGTAKRASLGLIDVALARDVDDSNMVHIVFDIKDMAKAKARMNDPELKKLMTDAGVMGAPKIEFFTTAE
ncbi:MAG: hypothetical protein JST87_04985 [Bacteroidetes bacterium]|nr:hypothetical protein [Bacteroidota bacterium]